MKKRGFKTFHTKSKPQILMIALVLALAASTMAVQPARAHESIEVGPYRLLFEWEKEPAIIGERNAVIMEVIKDEEPVTGLENTLDVAILYAGRSFLGILEPTGDPGVYRIEILPTVRGTYELSLSGTIEDLVITEVLELEDILSTSVLDFPEVQPDPREMQADIDRLQNDLNAFRIIAIGSGFFGLLGTILSGLLWVGRRRGS